MAREISDLMFASRVFALVAVLATDVLSVAWRVAMLVTPPSIGTNFTTVLDRLESMGFTREEIAATLVAREASLRTARDSSVVTWLCRADTVATVV